MDLVDSESLRRSNIVVHSSQARGWESKRGKAGRKGEEKRGAKKKNILYFVGCVFFAHSLGWLVIQRQIDVRNDPILMLNG